MTTKLKVLKVYVKYINLKMNNQQAITAAKEAQIAVEQSKLSYFHANSKFTGDQYLERFKYSRQARYWNKERTWSNFYNATRGKALKWYKILSVAKIEINNYKAFSTAFILPSNLFQIETL